MKLLVIFNPGAGSGKSGNRLGDIKAAFAEHSIDAEVHRTDYPGHGTALVAQADLSAYEGVVSAGGDGTAFEVLNGLYRHEAGDRVPLGLLPLGTGNAFSRDLGLAPGQWQKALQILTQRNTRWIDVGRVSTRNSQYHFLNIIGTGFVVDAGLAAKKFKALGNSAYTLGTLVAVLGMKSYPLRIEIDGKTLEQDNLFVEISNSRYTGTHFLIAPDARLDDGLLDVTLLRRLPRLRLLSLFPAIYQGKHVEYEEVSTFQAKHIRILSPGNMPLSPDGEFLGETPVDITCLKQDLELFAARD